VTFQFGPYLADNVLGHGANGVAMRAQHESTGQVVTIKVPAMGDGIVLARLGQTVPPGLLRIYNGGLAPEHQWIYIWVAREFADECLADVLAERQLASDEAQTIFRTCCETVAWLHAQQIYQWSSHPGNVYRVGHTWKLGDMGRCVAFVDPDHPAVAEFELDMRMQTVGGLPDELLGAYVGSNPSRTGFWPYDPVWEARLRMDDCSMLGGLLCSMLTGKRWEWFFRALNKRPYCSARYSFTGDRDVDERLSAVVNRAWRGDAGGALLVANAGRGEQTSYEDALELLQDVTKALDSVSEGGADSCVRGRTTSGS
jgi:hypothetical protein